MSQAPWEGISLEGRDLPPGWHLKALAAAAAALGVAVTLAWKTLL